MPQHRNSTRGNSTVRDLIHLHLQGVDKDKVPEHINTKNTIININFVFFFLEIRNVYVDKAL